MVRFEMFNLENLSYVMARQNIILKFRNNEFEQWSEELHKHIIFFKFDTNGE